MLTVEKKKGQEWLFLIKEKNYFTWAGRGGDGSSRHSRLRRSFQSTWLVLDGVWPSQAAEKGPTGSRDPSHLELLPSGPGAGGLGVGRAVPTRGGQGGT